MGATMEDDDDALVFEDSEQSYDNDASLGGSNSDASSDQGADDSSEDRRKRAAAHREGLVGSKLTRTLRKLRQLLWLVLFGIMGISTIGMYWFSYHDETTLFRTEFEGHSRKLLEGLTSDAHRKLEGLQSLSTFLTLHALEQVESESDNALELESPWPMVTIPHSALRLEGYLSVVGAAALLIMPIVPPHLRTQWEEYSVQQQSWIDIAVRESDILTNTQKHNDDSHEEEESEGGGDDHGHGHRQRRRHLAQTSNATTAAPAATTATEATGSSSSSSKKDSISPFIQADVGRDPTNGPWAVWWQYAPASSERSMINYNFFDNADFKAETTAVVERQSAALSHTYLYTHDPDMKHTSMSTILEKRHQVVDYHEPFVNLHYPVFEYMDRNSNTVAIISATLHWRNYFESRLPQGVNGIICVVSNTRGQHFTYRIDGQQAVYLGLEDLHDPAYDYMALEGGFVDSHRGGDADEHSSAPLDEEYMFYTVKVYPSSTLEATYRTSTPFVVACAMVLLFLLTAFIFQSYDKYIAQRQDIIASRAAKTDQIVASLFPDTVRARILGEDNDGDESCHGVGGDGKKKKFGSGQSVMSTRSTGSGNMGGSDGNVIADFYPEATVLFTDIKGFTAWCSQREPSQVFILLETLYNTYDIIAKKRKVFKVETIGDCYMAVTGLPEPRADHAVIMCKFARECLSKMHGLLAGLSVTLGPGTADLSMRFGIHSGPVTAGVIRSQNARFQLFGDTVNTAARMESNGEAGRIHISQETALQLAIHGKGHWYVPREEKIVAKGKGELQTYWLKVAVDDDDNRSSSGRSATSSECKKLLAAGILPTKTNSKEQQQSEIEGLTIAVVDDNSSRVIDWIVDSLSGYLQQIAAHRCECGMRPEDSRGGSIMQHSVGFTMFEELENTPMPTFDTFQPVSGKAATGDVDSRAIDELYTYVYNIVGMYNDNPFHNFEHAAHVSMSVIKLLGRIVVPDDMDCNDPRMAFADPLTRFTCVLSALIHDVGHNGVPNAQLNEEQDKYAVHYGGRSVAEQMAIDVGWRLLMMPQYVHLRSAIFFNEEEMQRFRYILITAVLATDIADADLRKARQERWQRAFGDEASIHSSLSSPYMSPTALQSLQALLSIETLLQVSDLAHTMQHWEVYRKFNERFYCECIAAYEKGRADTDPRKDWHKGETGFFDHCVIPLAKRLKECGVFGVSSDECLTYAKANRDQWVSTGKEVTREMIKKQQQREDRPGKLDL